MGLLDADQRQLSAAMIAKRCGRRLDSVAHGRAFRGNGGSGVCPDNAPAGQKVPVTQPRQPRVTSRRCVAPSSLSSMMRGLPETAMPSNAAAAIPRETDLGLVTLIS